MGTRAPLPQKADDFGEIIRVESKGLAMHLCKLSCLVPLESPCRLCGGGGGGGAKLCTYPSVKNTALAENTVKPLLKTKRQIAIPSTFYTLALKAASSFADLIFGIPTRAQRFYIFWVLSAK